MKNERIEHNCNNMPEFYSIIFTGDEIEKEWQVQDTTYKFIDKVVFCPFCGKNLVGAKP